MQSRTVSVAYGSFERGVEDENLIRDFQETFVKLLRIIHKKQVSRIVKALAWDIATAREQRINSLSDSVTLTLAHFATDDFATDDFARVASSDGSDGGMTSTLVPGTDYWWKEVSELHSFYELVM